MSNSIDKRIVEMQFDNQQFEANARTSMSTLDSLKKSLDLSGASKGFDELDKAAGKVDMSALGSAVETVKSKFSALEVIATTALVRITNEAINTGKQLLSSLTVDQINAGWGKYAEKTSAVQTIMAATAKDFDDTGEQMEYVNSQLEKLNWFTDETSYSFLDMVQNIGKFTSNRIPLDQSVTAMQGISNWAAISGANVTEAGRAMYNLAQAIAVGRVQLIDWKSVENANMATAEFKETAIETALAMGTLKKGADGVIKTLGGDEVSVSNFNAALTEGKWFTSDVLMSVLNQYGSFADELYKTTEKTGLTASELLSYIDEYEAGTLDLSEVAKKTGLSANELEASFKTLGAETMDLGRRSFKAAQEAKTFKDALDSVKDAVSTGWMNTFELIFGNYQEAKVLWTDLANAMYDAFAGSAEARNELLSGWRDLGGRNLLIESFWNTWEAIGNVIGTIKGAFRDIFPPATAEQLYAATQKLSEFTEKLKSISENSEGMDKLRRILSGLFSGFDIGRQTFSALWSGFKSLITYLSPAGSTIVDILATCGDKITAINRRLKETGAIPELINKGVTKLKELFEAVASVIEKIKTHSLADLNGIETAIAPLKDLIEICTSGKFSIRFSSSSALAKIREFFGDIVEFACSFRNIAVLDKLRSSLPQVAKSIGDFVTNIDGADLAVATGSVLGGGLIVKLIGFINDLKSVKDTVTKNLGEVSECITDTINSFGSDKKKTSTTIAKTILSIAASIALLASAFYIISKIDVDKLGGAMVAIGTITIAIVGLSFALSRIKIRGAVSSVITSIGLISLATSMLLFANVLSKLAKLNETELVKGIAGLGVVLLELAAFLALTKKAKIGVFKGAGLILTAVSIKLFADTVSRIGDMDAGKIVKGIAGLGVVLLELAAFLALTKKAKIGVFKGAGLILTAVSIKLFVDTISFIGDLNVGTILKGIIGLGAVLLEIAAFMKVLSRGKIRGATKSFLMLGVMAISMQVFVKALKHLEDIEIGKMLSFSASFGAVLLSLSVSMALLSKMPVVSAIGAIGKMALVIGGVVALMALFGTIEKAFGAASYIDSFGNLAESIGRAIGRLIGGLGSGIMSGLNMPQIATDLSRFMVNIQPFLDGCKNVDESVKNGVGNLASVVSEIGKAEFSAAISSWFVGENPIYKFAEDIPLIGQALSAFVESISGLNEADHDKLNNATIAAKGLAELAKAVPWTAPEWAQAIVGYRDVEQFADDAKTLSAALMDYARGVSGLGQIANQRDLDGSVTIAKGLTEVAKEIPSEGGWLQGILGIKDLGSFALSICSFGEGIHNYATIINGISSAATTEDTDFVCTVATGLSRVAETISSEGGWLQTIFGSKNLGSFAQNATSFGRSIRNYATIINGISSAATTEDIDFVCTVATGLSRVANSLPSTNGDWQKFAGEQNIATFGKAIADFAVPLVEFGETIAGFSSTFTQSDIDNAVNTATALADVSKKLPDTGGNWQDFWGTKDLGVFGNQCGALGEGLASFAVNVAGIKIDNVNAAIDVATALQTFLESFTKSGGWWTNVTTELGGGDTKEKTLANLTSLMVSTSEKLKQFSDNIAEIPFVSIQLKLLLMQNSFSAFQSLLDGLSDPSKNAGYFKKYGTAMGDMGTYLKTLSDKAVDCDMSAVSQAISAISELIALTNSADGINVSNADNIADMLNAYSGLDLSSVGQNLGKTLALAITSAVQDGTENFTAAVTRLFLAGVSAMNASRSHWTNGMRTLVSSIVQTFTAGTVSFATAAGNLASAGLKAIVSTQTSWRNGAKMLGNAFVLALLSTLQDAQVKMSSAAAALGNAGASSASATQNAWYSAGRNLGQGLANGVASMAGKVRSAAANAASGAVSAVKNAWKVHSPSRVGAELGMYFDYGLANGLTNYSRAVSNSAGSVGEGAVESARLVLAGLSSGMLDDIDPNPTIRPVLDLSNVESGVDRIDGLFGAKRSVDTSLFNNVNSFRNVRALNFEGTRLAGAQGNKEVVAELQQLTQRFNHLAEAVSNMQLVLDTGTLVGATSAKMDTQLGTLASRRGRGN